MRKKILPHPNKTFDELTLAFTESFEFEDLMGALTFAVEKGIHNCDALLNVWRTNAGNVKAVEPFQLYSELLVMINVDWSDPDWDPIEFEEKKKKLNESGCNIKDLIKDFKQQMEYREEEFSGKYDWFESSFVYGEILKAVYPEELDPGVIIGTYLNYLFSSGKDRRFLGKKVQQQLNKSALPDPYAKYFSLEVGSTLHTLMNAVGEWVIAVDSKDNITIKAALHCILFPHKYDSLPFDEGVTIEHIMFNILTTPQLFVAAWITRYWLKGDNDGEGSPRLTQDAISCALLLFPFGECKTLKPLLDENVSIESEALKGINKVVFAIKLLKQEMKDKVFDAYFNWDTFTTFCLKYRNEGAYLNYENSKLAQELHANYTHQRRTYNNGISLMDQMDCANIYDFFRDGLAPDEMDLTLMLSYGCHCHGDLYLFEIVDEHNAADNFELLEEYSKKQHIYLVLFDKALEEGLPELGNALLSLFLIALAISTNGQLLSLSTITPAIQKGLIIPGSATLKHTLQTIVEFIESLPEHDPASELVKRVFKSYLPGAASLHKITGSKKHTNAEEKIEVDRQLEKILGKERLKKLSSQSQTYLKDAELTWRTSAIHFGAGMKDWSGHISGYCKVLEKELVDRLQPMFTSKQYGEYLAKYHRKRPKKATPGLLLNELKKFNNMPSQLQEIIKDSGITLYQDQRLVHEIYGLFQTYRNVAAHKDPFDMVKYASFKQKYFDGGLLSRFIDHLQ